jgi:minichromosome maintenance protein 10
MKSRSLEEDGDAQETNRSSGFSERPPPPSAQTRDDRGAIIEDIPLGPAEHTAPFDDPRFEHLEPNSNIRLS